MVLVATAKDYLSYFDPSSDAEMTVTAPRIPAGLPVFTAIGEKDPLFKIVKERYVDKLPPNPKHKYLEVGGGHLDTPREASEALITWIQSVVSQ